MKFYAKRLAARAAPREAPHSFDKDLLQLFGLGDSSNQNEYPLHAPNRYGDAPSKNEGAIALGKLGGKARAASTTTEQRKKIAQQAAKVRWKSK